MKINVTQQDIDNGIPNNAYECPIALSLCRLIGVDSDDEIVEVLQDCILIRTVSPELTWMLDDKAIAFIEYFDNENPVEPCTIEATCSV